MFIETEIVSKIPGGLDGGMRTFKQRQSRQRSKEKGVGAIEPAIPEEATSARGELLLEAERRHGREESGDAGLGVSTEKTQGRRRGGEASSFTDFLDQFLTSFRKFSF